MPPKLGIVAGRGELPAHLLQACRATGREVFVLAIRHETDEALAPKIEALGVDVVVTDTIMKSMAKKSALARTVLAALGAK